jgi:mannose-6-phosphate isomerase
MQSLYKLRGVVQHYSWGGNEFIPNLIGKENEEKKPFAEYWLGAHPNSPAQLLNGEEVSLYTAIQQSPDEVLGGRVKQEFGTLPYLFKILDVKQMLSIQVHPSIESAVKGYADENKKGIPVTAPHRNYKDQNHKPELMAALSDFWLLHGFKTEEGIYRIFDTVSELSFLRDEFAQKSYKGLYETVMKMPQEEVDKVLAPLMQKIVPQYEAGELEKSSEHFWAARAVLTFCKNGHYDRGIFSIYFFNLLHLKEGEGIYQPAGLPHAYLEGQNVEVMANSDNVLRAGLTDKHIDVPELMKHVKFEPTVPNIIPAREDQEQVYSTPAAEFELTKFILSDAAFFNTESAAIFFVYDGNVALSTNEMKLDLSRGEAALVLANKTFEIKPDNCTATVFAVTTPVGKK